MTIWSQTAASSGPGTLSSSSARASLSPSPSDRQLRQPSEDVVADAACALRTRPRSARRGGGGRRNPRICAEARSSHCASSTMQTSGCCSATSANSVSAASPTRNRSGAGPAALAEHRRERFPLRGGQPVEVIQHRPAELMEAAVGQLHLRLNTNGPRDVPAGDPLGQSNPAARSCQRPPRPAATVTSAPTGERVGQEPVECLALALDVRGASNVEPDPGSSAASRRQTLPGNDPKLSRHQRRSYGSLDTPTRARTREFHGRDAASSKREAWVSDTTQGGRYEA